MKKIIVFYLLLFTTFFTFAQPKVALVLSGGGANGLAEIPLLEALEEEGIEVDFIVGVSMGAIIGSLYASGYTPKQIRQIMTTLDLPGIINQRASQSKALPPMPENPFYSNLYSIDFSKEGFGSQPGLVGDQKITNMLANFLSKTSHIKDFDNFSKPFRAVSTDVFTGKKIISDSGSLLCAVRGSMAVPVVFSPFPVGEGKLAYDGGLSDNLPIQLAKEMGADVIIAMDVLANIGVNQEDFGTINSNFVQSINLIISMNTLDQYEDADILIRPDLSALSAAAFGNAKEIIQIGEKAVSEQREEIHQLAIKLEKEGFELKKLDYDRDSLYDSLPSPIISGIEIKDISLNKNSSQTPLPKVSDFSYFLGKEADEDLCLKLNTKLEQLRYYYNLATLSYEFSEDDSPANTRLQDSLNSTGPQRKLVILANHYASPQDRLFIGGRPSLECYFTNGELPSFVMLPFFSAGMIVRDILPLSLAFSSDKFFSGELRIQPIISKTKNHIFSLGGGFSAKYGALHPEKILTYSTLLADDDFGFGANLNFNAQFMEVMNAESGIDYEFLHLNQRGVSAGGENPFNLFSWYIQFAADTLQNDISGLSGLRIDSKLKAGLNTSGSFFYSGDASIQQQFEVFQGRSSFGYYARAFINRYPESLIQGYFDAGGYYGMCGYEHGCYRRTAAWGGISWKQKLFSPADMPVLLISQIKAGITDGDFDMGASLGISLKTPFGNLVLGGGYSVFQKKWCMNLTFM
ncbi:MAG: patatin-like phospholipase family protein [Treponema sp.]|nr:patatin-like phospholipase family protein [Treponema sp.]